MHYHIFWGSKLANEPFVLNFSDKNEAIDRFISLIKGVEGESAAEGPPNWEERKIDKKSKSFEVVTEKHKYMLVFCDYDCPKKEAGEVVISN